MLFNIKNHLTRFVSGIGSHIASLFSNKQFNSEDIGKVEKLLLESDVGLPTTQFIIKELKEKIQQGSELEIQKVLPELLSLSLLSFNNTLYKVYLLVGINGSGKTTLAAKLAYHEIQTGNRPLLVAADTFRAAAVDQLQQWARNYSFDIVTPHSQDPASVVFEGCKKYREEKYDTLIIDTAGRLQTKANLMQELAKLKRVIAKHIPETEICTVLTIDATLGQNSLQQARIFNESTNLTALALTKYDSMAKGGTLFAISKELSLPVAWISYGESIDALKQFDCMEFCTAFVQS